MAIRKSKVTITFYLIHLSKVLLFEFHYDYIKNKYDNKSRVLIIDTDSVMNEIKTEDVYENFINVKKMFDSRNYSAEPKRYNDLNKLVVGKIKDKISSVAAEELVGLNPKMYLFWWMILVSITKQSI